MLLLLLLVVVPFRSLSERKTLELEDTPMKQKEEQDSVNTKIQEQKNVQEGQRKQINQN